MQAAGIIHNWSKPPTYATGYYYVNRMGLVRAVKDEPSFINHWFLCGFTDLWNVTSSTGRLHVPGTIAAEHVNTPRRERC